MNVADYRAQRAAATAATPTAKPKDWTDGNSSKLYRDTVEYVEQLIRENGSDLISGYTNQVARIIVSQLAHGRGFLPGAETRTKYDTPVIDNLQRQLDGKDMVIEEQRRTIRELTAALAGERERIALELGNKMAGTLADAVEDFGRTYGLERA